NAGALTFATLTAVDEDAGPLMGPDDRGFGRNRTFNVARVQYSLKPGSYVGAIVTDTEQPGAFNRVVGTDLSLKPTSNQTVSLLALESISHRPEQTGSASGFGGQARY